VLTTGTGSGKSLAYIIPVVDRVPAAKTAGTYRPGIKAIVVYPMNALANSQLRELQKFLKVGYPEGPPVTFDRYTGQESAGDRSHRQSNCPLRPGSASSRYRRTSAPTKSPRCRPVRFAHLPARAIRSRTPRTLRVRRERADPTQAG